MLIAQRLKAAFRQLQAGEATPGQILGRFAQRQRLQAYKLFGVDYHTGHRISRGLPLERIGTTYGGWTVPAGLIDPQSICYCVGVGEDITFDLGLIERYGCDVHAYDPTPRAVAFVERTCHDMAKYHFYPYGLWDEETVLRFYAPADPAHVSHSILNLQKTDHYFEAPCRRLSSVMRENGHARLDLLKLDIEGAEYRVLASLIDDGLDVRVICVEYDEIRSPLDGEYRSRVKASLDRLLDYGYRLAAVEFSNYTLVRASPAPASSAVGR